MPDVLVSLYRLLAVAAIGRSTVQLAGHPGRAPLAYALSALAGVVYAVGAVLLNRGAFERARTVIIVELVTVLVVGVASIIRPSAFPQSTVWSSFGLGYGLLPLILPVVALRRLSALRPRSGAATDQVPAGHPGRT